MIYFDNHYLYRISTMIVKLNITISINISIYRIYLYFMSEAIVFRLDFDHPRPHFVGELDPSPRRGRYHGSRRTRHGVWRWINNWGPVT